MAVKKKIISSQFFYQIILIFFAIHGNAVHCQSINFAGALGNIYQLDDIFSSVSNLTNTFSRKFSNSIFPNALFDPSNKQRSNEIKQSYKIIIEKLTDIEENVINFLAFTEVNDGLNDVINVLPDHVMKNLHEIGEIFSNATEQRLDILEDHDTFFSIVLNATTTDTFDNQKQVSQLLETNYQLLIDISASWPVFYPELLTTMLKHYQQEYTKRCDTYVSAQQQLYYISFTVIVSEIIGFLSYSHYYMLRKILGFGQFNEDIQEIHHQHINRIFDYMYATRKEMPQLFTVIRRCEPRVWIRNHSFVELEHYIQNWYLDGTEYHHVDSDNVEHNKSCSDYLLAMKPDYVSKMIGCFNITNPTNVCYSPQKSSRVMEWIDESNVDYHGRFYECPTGVIIYEGTQATNEKSCFANVCTVIRRHKITTAAQTSNQLMNMIITGVRFIRFNDSLQIQIQEGELIGAGYVHPSNSWTDINDDTHLFMDDNEGIHQIYLDDVIVPTGYVVTGVRFSPTKNGRGIKILVRGTKYNFSTGQLSISDYEWFDPEKLYADKPWTPLPNTDDNDDSCLATNNIAIEESHHSIVFEHTNFHHDAGQMTIPLFDAQPVTMKPGFPLNGIGLYYKGQKGFGGFISLRIFTDDLNDYLKPLVKPAKV